ncbi:MAG: hypothetical protein ACT4N1_02125 [Nitrososphaerota archaeon]
MSKKVNCQDIRILKNLSDDNLTLTGAVIPLINFGLSTNSLISLSKYRLVPIAEFRQYFGLPDFLGEIGQGINT